MSVEMMKEPLIGKYHGVASPLLLPAGSVSDGKNMRKIAETGGWKVRKGCTLYYGTALGSQIDSLHYYENPRNNDAHFLVQYNSKLRLESTSNELPPNTTSDFGTDVAQGVGSEPGFSTVVGENWFYADGGNRPLVFGGNNPYCTGFLVYDDSATAYVDYTRLATNGRTDTLILLGTSASDVFYVGAMEPIDGVKFDVSAANVVTASLAVASWVDGAWENRSGESDGTASGGVCLAQDGTLTWTKGTSDSMRVLGGIMAYWYRITPSTGIYSAASTYASDGADVNEDCSAQGSWVTDEDDVGGGNAETTYNVSFGGEDNFRFQIVTAGVGTRAAATLAAGALTNNPTIEIRTYFDEIGNVGDSNWFVLRVDINSNDAFLVNFAADGLFVYDGAAYNEVGTNVVSKDVYQTWVFDLTESGHTATIYLDDIEIATGVDWSFSPGGLTEGDILLRAAGNTVQTDAYVDYLKIGAEDFSEAAPVKLAEVQVNMDPSLLTNKWNGIYEFLSGIRFYDASEDEFVEALGKVSNESTSQYLTMDAATSSDYLYIKTIEPATGFGFGIVQDYNNAAAQVVDLIEYWNGSAWTTVGTLIDTTKDVAGASSFSQTGSIFFNATQLSPQRRTFEGDQIPGYWYRISWDGTLSSDLRIYLSIYAPFPESLPTYDGCVEFKGRLMLWGDPEFPNRLRFSAYDRPDCFSGSDSGYTETFGGMDPILSVLPFYNELIVFKETSVWLLEGYSQQTFGILRIADTVGLASKKSAAVVEVGYPGMHSDEPLSIAIWQDVDGIYVLDGRKPRKVSLPVDHYFNTEYATAIAAASIRNRQAFVDPLRNEYHILLPTEELVYNYVSDEWYPPWEREIDLTCGFSFRGSDNRYHVYAGDASGLVMRLENDTTDKETDGDDKAISHSIKTRAIALEQQRATTLRFTLAKLWAEFKARGAGAPTVKVYENLASLGTSLGTASMVNSGSTLATPEVKAWKKNLSCFELEFALNTADQEMEIWSFLYEVEARGEIIPSG